MTSTELDRRFTRTLVVALAATVVALLIGGYVYYRSETDRIRRGKFDDLSAIGALKAGQVETWRKERLTQANSVAKSPFVRRAVAELGRTPGDEGLRAQIRERLALEGQDEPIVRAALLDLEGKVLVATSDDPDPVCPAAQKAIAAALADREAKLSDLYRSAHGVVHLHVVAPVLGADGRPLAVVILRTDADAFLFPLIQSWPTPSPSAETLLVMRDGNDVLFLNELRHRAQTALSLRIPLSQTDVPAVQAVLGKRGLARGLDYRGVEVLSDLRPVAGSDWYLVAKIDADEILAEARYRAAMIALFVGLGILLAAAGIVVVYRQRQAQVLRSLYESERKEGEAREQFRATLYSIGDAVITTDRQACVKHMNPVAEALTGWPELDARGKPLAEIFHIVSEETRAVVQSPADRVLREGHVVGLANHTVLVARDGGERPIADSGAPIKGENGAVTGVVLVFRDQSAERAAQKALQDSERKYRELFENAQVGVYRSRMDGSAILAVNKKLCEIFGYSREELVGNPALIRWADPAARERMLAELRQQGHLDNYEMDIVTKSGSVRACIVSIKPYPEQGYIEGTATDVTEQKRARQALAASEERFRGIFEHSTVGKSLTMPDGKLLQVNGAFAGMLGYSVEAMQRVNFAEITHPDDIAESRECVRCVVAGERATYRMDKRYRHRDGHLVWADVSTTLFRDDAGNPLYLITTIVDITERKRHEAEMRVKDHVFEGSISAQSVADKTGAITHVNPAFLRLWGYATKQDAIGKSVGSFFADPADAALVLEALAANDAWDGEFRAKRVDGSRFISRGLAASMRNAEGELTGYQSANLDVTREREAEARLKGAMADVQRSNSELEQFAYVASHDLQEPLRMVASYTQLLAERYEGKLDDKAKKYIDYAVGGAVRMQRLINDLLTYSRISTQGKALELTDSHAALGEAIANLQAAIEESRAMVVSDDLPTVRADAGQLAQVFQNLVANAIKFHGAEPPRVHVSAREVGQAWRFSVEDNGIGIDAQYAERVFTIFQRLHTREEYPGTGIGLALCRRIVERHGGRIWLESEPGKGSTFFFTVPK